MTEAKTIVLYHSLFLVVLFRWSPK